MSSLSSAAASLPSVAQKIAKKQHSSTSSVQQHHNNHKQQQHYSSASSSTTTLNDADRDAARRGVINMRVTANSNPGHRKYMEDCYKIRFPRDTDNNNNSGGGGGGKTSSVSTSDSSDILFSYFGIFDGHGGKEAALYCKERLFWTIVELDDFWSDEDSRVLGAIREGFVKCHLEMWNELPSWPKTNNGLASTSGSTATVLFIKKNRAYVGHVGDSGLVIGYTKQMTTTRQASLASQWHGKKLTRDHKPEDPVELKRIESLGGSVMSKSGVNRVVWNKPLFKSNANLANTSQSCSNLNETKTSSQNQLHRVNSASIPFKMNYLRNQTNVPYEPVPFLAVARSLGDLWSYEMQHDDFLVSPVPDVFSFELDPRIHKCLILATDGLWNMMKPSECVEYVRQTDRETERLVQNRTMTSMKQSSAAASAQPFVNPSQKLASTAVQRCSERNIRADNTTCITIMLDNPVDEMDYDADETLNRTCFDRLLSNKTIELTRRFNDSDEIEDAYDEIDDDEDEDDGDDIDDELDSNTRGNRTTTNTTLTAGGGRRTRKKSLTDREPPTPKLTSTMVADPDEPPVGGTPLDSDKRSRSMISLRRRHWSASSNRSSSTIMPSATKPQQQQQVPIANKVFVNTQDRARRQLFTNVNQNVAQQQQHHLAINHKLNNTEIYYRPQQSEQQQHQRYHNQQQSSDTNFQKSSFINRTKSSHLNQSTNMNKFSKSLRKSFNDLYSATASKLNATLNQQPANMSSSTKSQENLKRFEMMLKEKEATVNSGESATTGVTIGQKYSKKLKCIKQRLVKTKNNLFGSKKTAAVNSDQENQKSQPGVVSSNGEQSFVSNVVKMKFLKRNRSSKLEQEETSTTTTATSNLNVTMSTALSNKLSNTHLGGTNNNNNNKIKSGRVAGTTTTNGRQIEHYECSPNKRPKFY